MYHGGKTGMEHYTPFPEVLMIAIAVRERYHVALHPHHDRLHHIVLNDGYLRAFLQSVENVSIQTLENIPFMRFTLAQRLEDLIGAGFRKMLSGILRDRRLGGFTIGVQGTTIRHEDYLKLATAIAHLVGPAHDDGLSGRYYSDYTVNDAENCPPFMQQAYRLFTLHTGGIFIDEPTDWLLMMKYEERNAVGGTCRLLHLDDWEECAFYSKHQFAMKEFSYKAPTRRHEIKTVKRRTFYKTDTGLGICFIDRFVHPETMEQATYLKEMSDSLERSSGALSVPLPVGDLIMLNNRFWLHGRSAYQKHADLHRELMRQHGTFALE